MACLFDQLRQTRRTPETRSHWDDVDTPRIAWKAQQRLHQRYQALSARGKNKNQIITAVGWELLGFIWAIGVSVEKQHPVTAAA